MAKFVVVENTPGYLPESEPIEHDNMSSCQLTIREIINELKELGYHVVVRTTTYVYLERNARDLGRVIEILRMEND